MADCLKSYVAISCELTGDLWSGQVSIAESQPITCWHIMKKCCLLEPHFYTIRYSWKYNLTPFKQTMVFGIQINIFASLMIQQQFDISFPYFFVSIFHGFLWKKISGLDKSFNFQFLFFHNLKNIWKISSWNSGFWISFHNWVSEIWDLGFGIFLF